MTEANRRTDPETRDRFEQLTLSTERLVQSTESLEKVVDIHQRWIDKHNETFQDLRFEVKQNQLSIDMWSQKLVRVETSIDRLTTELQSIVNDGLKIRGGWMMLSMVGSIGIGVLAIAKSFGFIG